MPDSHAPRSAETDHTCPCSCLCFCEGVTPYPDLGCTTPCPDFDSPHRPHGVADGPSTPTGKTTSGEGGEPS